MWWLEKMSKLPGDKIAVWLQHFGLTSKAVSIDVHTDSEKAVGEIIGNATGRYTFSIRRAVHPSSIVQSEQQKGLSGN